MTTTDAGGNRSIVLVDDQSEDATAAVALSVADLARSRHGLTIVHGKDRPPGWAGKLWAVGHLISNGDLGSIILFGSILAWAVYDRISFKYRTDDGASPLAGVLPAGMSDATKDILAVVLGTVIYLALGFWFHPYVVGVKVFGS